MTIYRLSFSFILILNSLVGLSQGMGNIWIVGYDSIMSVQTGRATIDFSGGGPNITWGFRRMPFGTTMSTMSDQSGNLLFYTNGVYLANALDDTMLNGDNINPSQYTTINNQSGLYIPQANLILPFPGDSTKYYLFHSTVDDMIISSTQYTYFSIVDMALDAGRGAVISKNNVIVNDTLFPGKMVAVKHANGRDWWVVCHKRNSNRFFKILVTPSGVSGPFIQDIGSIRGPGVGQVCFSPDGTKLAYLDQSFTLELFDFDRCSGDFSNAYQFMNNDSFAYGVAISPNSRFLYVSATYYMYQFDLNAPDVSASQVTVAINDSFASPSPPFYTYFAYVNLAPDGKIYANCGNGTDYLHVINYPDSEGVACDVCQHCIHLPVYDARTTPNVPNYFLAPVSGSICDSLPTQIQVSDNKSAHTLFPNPVHDLLYLSSSGTFENEQVFIYNMLGGQLSFENHLFKNGKYIEINTRDFKSGVYFVEIIRKDGREVRRFVKE